MKRNCTKCLKILPADCFHISKKGKLGRASVCKKCRSIHEKQDPDYRKRYYQENWDKYFRWRQDYYARNAEELRRKRRAYYHKNKDAHNEYSKEYQRRRRQSDPQWKLSQNFGAQVWLAIRDSKAGRHWETLVPYSLSDLVTHLEGGFQDGMSWDNYGLWHIDHIRPLCSFVYETPEDQEFQMCWSLGNLQPLWAKDNLSKGGKWREN